MTRVTSTMSGSPSTLFGVMASRKEMSTASRVAAVLFITALTAAAAQLSVPLPFTPVPFTLQPTVVILGGAALGSRLGMSSQVLYLLLGVAGLPVFAASPLLPQGAARLFGPTAGYLLAYPFAAWVAGYLAERRFDRKYLTSVVAMLAGMIVLYTGGALRLAYGPPAPMGLWHAMQAGVIPFFAVDLIKMCVAAGVLPTVWKLVTPEPGS